MIGSVYPFYKSDSKVGNKAHLPLGFYTYKIRLILYRIKSFRMWINDIK